MLDTFSDRSQALASQHFPVISTLDVAIPKHEQRDPKLHVGCHGLNDALIAQRFAERTGSSFQALNQPCHNDSEKINAFYGNLCDSFASAASELLPPLKSQPRKPWISDASLTFIDKRNDARRQGNFDLERELTLIIKRRFVMISQCGFSL